MTWLALLAFVAAPLAAQNAAPQVAPPQVRRTQAPPTQSPRTILFVGNSFTFGANSPVMRFRPGSVVDLTGQGFGGVPALFKAFTAQVGLDYSVYSETQGGQTLRFHYEQRRALIDRRWDAVVLQEYSTLDPQRPGNPENYQRYAGAIAKMLTARNPRVNVALMPTWSRADQTYKAGGAWAGRPITAMADDIARAAARVRASSRDIAMIIPAGQAWNRAMQAGIADPNPYDGVSYGQINLWTWDQYHASAYGYYLEALVAFGRVTGTDPRVLGREERAAQDLGLNPDTVVRLQTLAWETLRDTR
ncbi:Glycosyl transferase family 1 [Sphingomonas sp. EC-HK361]|uniref:DUF4886 domain-containing protein n=1 Tax=Sphingomonas sp. EC-HK361 TaxID=2038397 RepID=UPI0012547A11|nr:DUF4886 domain-containing protein [Sphingomonas sp. EC-HK361]VVS98326.1 Glycosyl transferase family 1 [Sphingomonas sp. EC-HK361]